MQTITLTISQQQGRKFNKLAFCSSLTTSTLVPKPYYNRLILSDSERTAANIYAKVTEGTVTNSL